MKAENVTQQERELKIDQQGVIICLTGLSGAGKTTLGTVLTRKLFGTHMFNTLINLKILELIQGFNGGLHHYLIYI